MQKINIEFFNNKIERSCIFLNNVKNLNDCKIGPLDVIFEKVKKDNNEIIFEDNEIKIIYRYIFSHSLVKYFSFKDACNKLNKSTLICFRNNNKKEDNFKNNEIPDTLSYKFETNNSDFLSFLLFINKNMNSMLSTLLDSYDIFKNNCIRYQEYKNLEINSDDVFFDNIKNIFLKKEKMNFIDLNEIIKMGFLNISKSTITLEINESNVSRLKIIFSEKNTLIVNNMILKSIDINLFEDYGILNQINFKKKTDLYNTTLNFINDMGNNSSLFSKNKNFYLKGKKYRKLVKLCSADMRKFNFIEENETGTHYKGVILPQVFKYWSMPISIIKKDNKLMFNYHNKEVAKNKKKEYLEIVKNVESESYKNFIKIFYSLNNNYPFLKNAKTVLKNFLLNLNEFSFDDDLFYLFLINNSMVNDIYCFYKDCHYSLDLIENKMHLCNQGKIKEIDLWKFVLDNLK